MPAALRFWAANSPFMGVLVASVLVHAALFAWCLSQPRHALQSAAIVPNFIELNALPTPEPPVLAPERVARPRARPARAVVRRAKRVVAPPPSPEASQAVLPQAAPVHAAPLTIAKTMPSGQGLAVAAQVSGKAVSRGVAGGGVPDRAAPSRQGAAPGSLDASARRTLTQGYLKRLIRLLAKHQHYPRAARRARLEGTVTLALAIDREGRILKRQLRRSSGHALLDSAALASLAELKRLPPPPGALHWQKRSVAVPVVYRLR